MPLAVDTLRSMPESAKKPFVVFIYSVLILSTFLVFWQVRSFPFISYDDYDYASGNRHVLNGLTWDGTIWAFTASHASNWHPVTWLSLMLDCQLFGADPGWMHLVNVLLHLANALLLFAVLWRMTGSLWPSAFVAAAFTLHPMHVESVAWITERKDVLSMFFLLLTLAAYANYVRRGGILRYLLSVLLFALGLMAKPMLVTLPFLLLLLDYWPLGRFDLSQVPGRGTGSSAGRDKHRGLYPVIVEKTPFFILSVVSCVITFVAQQSSGAVIAASKLPLQDRLANALLSLVKYLGKMLWPRDLAVYYPLGDGSPAFGQVAVCFLLLLAISICVIRFGRDRKYLPVGWFWFVGTLVPVIGIVQVGGQAIADRYTYIPYTGLFIMIAWGLPQLLPEWPLRRLVLGVFAVVVLGVIGTCAYWQIGYWRNSIVLFSHAIDITTRNDVAYNSRGAAYYNLGRWQEVVEDCSRAIAIAPDYAEAHNNRGVAYRELGRWQDAIDDLGEAIRNKPDYADAYNNRGLAYGRLGRWQEAVDDFSQALNIAPDYAEAYNDRGVAYGGLGRYKEATDDFARAIRIKPNYAEACNNRGLAFGGLGRHDDAVAAYEQAIRIKPDFAEAHANLARELAGQGRYDEAVGQYRAALKLKGDQPSLMNSLAWLIATDQDIKNRDAGEAIRLAGRACEFTAYRDVAFLDTLAAAYAFAGRFPEAVDTANKAVALAETANQPALRDAIRRHLSFYTQGKPYIEPSAKPQPGVPTP